MLDVKCDECDGQGVLAHGDLWTPGDKKGLLILAVIVFMVGSFLQRPDILGYAVIG